MQGLKYGARINPHPENPPPGRLGAAPCLNLFKLPFANPSLGSRWELVIPLGLRATRGVIWWSRGGTAGTESAPLVFGGGRGGGTSSTGAPPVPVSSLRGVTVAASILWHPLRRSPCRRGAVMLNTPGVWFGCSQGYFLGGCSGPGLKGMCPQILPLAPSFKEGIGQGRTAGRIPSLGEELPSCRESGAGACCSVPLTHVLSPKCSELGSGSCAGGGEEQREKSRGAESAPGRMMELG